MDMQLGHPELHYPHLSEDQPRFIVVTYRYPSETCPHESNSSVDCQPQQWHHSGKFNILSQLKGQKIASQQMCTDIQTLKHCKSCVVILSESVTET